MFLNATMLAGVAGAVLPLVLHLLNRARYRNVRWGAMMFLALEDSRHHRASQFKELTLLILRMAIVATLAVALARPVLGAIAASPSASSSAARTNLTDEPSCTVILMDRSGSMGYEENGRPRMDAARRAVLAVIGSLRRGDEAALVLTPELLNLPPQLTTDLETLASRAADMRWTSGRADLAAGLNAATRVLETSHSRQKQLIVVCDRQAASWRDVNETFARTWRQAIRDSNKGRMPRLAVVPVGAEDAGNVAIDSVRIVNLPVIKDTPITLEVVVRNFDTLPRSALPLTILNGTRQILSRSIDVDPGASKAVRCVVALSTTGSTVLTARLSPAGMPADDSMDCAAEVVDPIGVLVISGDESSGATAGSSRFIRAALAPFATSGEPRGADPAKVQFVTSDDWPELDRSKHRVVILANVPRFSLRQVRQLEQYVYGGGGLLVAPGNLAYVDEYNAQLWRDGGGVLPAQLGSPLVAGSERLAMISIERVESDHPAFAFVEAGDSTVKDIKISRYFPTLQAPSAKVLGRLSSGEPFMIEGTYGRGRALLVTTSLDAEWSNLPATRFYLPMMQSAVRYLAAGMVPDRNLSPGETAVATISDIVEPTATMIGPQIGSRGLPVEMFRVSDGYEARFAATSRPGHYTLRVNGAAPDARQRQIDFIVRPTRDESDLLCLTDEQWTRLQSQLGLERIDDQPQEIAGLIWQWRRRHELWPVLLGCVILLALLEMGLARFWTRPPVDRGEA